MQLCCSLGRILPSMHKHVHAAFFSGEFCLFDMFAARAFADGVVVFKPGLVFWCDAGFEGLSPQTSPFSNLLIFCRGKLVVQPGIVTRLVSLVTLQRSSELPTRKSAEQVLWKVPPQTGEKVLRGQNRSIIIKIGFHFSEGVSTGLWCIPGCGSCLQKASSRSHKKKKTFHFLQQTLVCTQSEGKLVVTS